MDIHDVRTLLDYHYWARDRLLDAVEPLDAEQFTRDMGNSFRSIRDTVAHIYAAEHIWCARWHGESPAALLPATVFPDVPAARRIWQEHEARMRAFFEQAGPDGIHQVIAYKTLDGRPGTSSLTDMLQHVVNHSSYHRGQVTTMLRQLGTPAPRSMDLIAFYRERRG